MVIYGEYIMKININLNTTKQFTQEHLETLEKLRVKEKYPKLYGDKALPGVHYLETTIIPLDKLDTGNKYFDQLVRVSNNPEQSSIYSDIDNEGWSLGELPIAAFEYNGNMCLTAEGRTRVSYLESKKVKNVIIDKYKPMDRPTLRRFAQFYNNMKKPFGKSSYNDIRKSVLDNIEELKITTEDKILKEIKYQSGHKLTDSQINELVADAINHIKGEKSILSFKNGQKVDNWLEEYNYTEHVDPITEKHIVYVWCSSFIEKFHSIHINLADEWDDYDENGFKYEIRIIIHGSTLNAKDREKDWKTKCRDFAKNLKTYEKRISKLRYGGKPIVTSDKFVIFGTIPMLKSLEKSYPMNKLYLFSKDK